MIEQYYEFLVNRGTFFTAIMLIVMYTYTIYNIHKNKTGTVYNRVFFILLTLALIPKFLAQLTLMLVHGAYGSFVAEVANLAPVVYIVIINEYFLRLNVVGYCKEKRGV